MHTVAITVLVLYAVLNLALAVAARARPVPGTTGSDRLPAAALFALGGVVLLVGTAARAGLAVGAGLVVASAAALVYALTVEREAQPLHHVVRAVAAAGMMTLWLQT